ncbi:MAG: FprA family A-type flavoprotein [Oscillospiraceae bacterium]|jgi:flavorubredoxin|nr:FprA family A-type flavoprotein [Oscillospiraceae bacterium]
MNIKMTKITESVTYAGVLNPGMRTFDVIMHTEYGTSYNSYVVDGSEKTAIIEASHISFGNAYKGIIDEALGGKTPDYLILNHTEPDHSGCVKQVVQWFPYIEIVCTKAASIYLKNITNNDSLNFKIVKTGDELDLGGKTLQFYAAPFLHWPDSMFTYLPQDKVAFTCDFLGSHYCEPQVFDTDVTYPKKYIDSLKNYYDCIFAPFKPYVLSGLDILNSLDVEIVCPSHGPVLTSGGNLNTVKDAYLEWSTVVERENVLIPIFYCSAYGNTKKIAQAVQKGILQIFPNAECETYNIKNHNIAELAGLLNGCDAFLLGPLTINRDVVPPIWQLLAHADAINMAKRSVALFGSFGWSGEGFAHTAMRLQQLKCNLYDEQFKVNFVPTEEDLANAVAFGKRFAQTV